MSQTNRRQNKKPWAFANIQGGQMDNDKLGIEIPQQEIESFTRLLLPKIQQFFKSEEGQREFAEWKWKQAENDSIEAEW